MIPGIRCPVISGFAYHRNRTTGLLVSLIVMPRGFWGRVNIVAGLVVQSLWESQDQAVAIHSDVGPQNMVLQNCWVHDNVHRQINWMSHRSLSDNIAI